MTAPRSNTASDDVGYGKPPRHTQFKKGQSGNPGGRPRKSPAGRLKALALREAYGTIVVGDEYGQPMRIPAIQAVLRSQLKLAVAGNLRAQRDLLAMIRDFEEEDGGDATGSPMTGEGDVDDDDVVDAAGGDEAEDDEADGDSLPADDAGAAGDARHDEPAREQAAGSSHARSAPPYDRARQRTRRLPPPADPAAPPPVKRWSQVLAERAERAERDGRG
jgi:Family of unknown function (DUF5681)